MIRRCIAPAIGAAVAVVIAVVVQVPVAAGQTPAPATKRAAAARTSVPRTEGGQPDLRGIWNFGSATPRQRPDTLADKQILTADQAAAGEGEAARSRQH